MSTLINHTLPQTCPIESFQNTKQRSPQPELGQSFTSLVLDLGLFFRLLRRRLVSNVASGQTYIRTGPDTILLALEVLFGYLYFQLLHV